MAKDSVWDQLVDQLFLKFSFWSNVPRLPFTNAIKVDILGVMNGEKIGDKDHLIPSLEGLANGNAIALLTYSCAQHS